MLTYDVVCCTYQQVRLFVCYEVSVCMYNIGSFEFIARFRICSVFAKTIISVGSQYLHLTSVVRPISNVLAAVENINQKRRYILILVSENCLESSVWMYIVSIGRHSGFGSEAICEHRRLCRCKSQDSLKFRCNYHTQTRLLQRKVLLPSVLPSSAKLLAMVMPDNSINPPSIRHGDGFSFLRDDPVVYRRNWLKSFRVATLTMCAYKQQQQLRRFVAR